MAAEWRFDMKFMTKGEKIFIVFNYLFLTLLTLTTLFPLVNIIAMSLSSNRAIISGEVTFFPVEFNVEAYRNVISNGQIFPAMKNTVVVTVVGTLLCMFFTICASYALSKKELPFKKAITGYILFTMLFNGGMIPSFLLINKLHLINSFWAIWLSGLVSVYNMIVMKTFFQGIPQSLEESAEIDGAGVIRVLFKIVLPLSKPIIATIGLFYAVAFWNNYMDALIYLSKPEKYTLMVKLKQMLMIVSDEMKKSGMGTNETEQLTPETIKATSIVIATVPIMCVYPFLQKYFVKGVMIGSVKG